MGRKKGSDLVKRRSGSQNYWIDITIDGCRIRHSLGTDDRDTAEILAAEIRKNALLGRLITVKPEIRLTEALGRFWLEHGQFVPSKRNIKIWSECLESYLGKHTLLSQITPSVVVSYVAQRRIGRAGGTVNNELRFLNQLLKRADDLWCAAAQPFELKDFRLPERDNRQHILTPSEEDRLFAGLRPDMCGMVCFALITGLRLSNVIYLKWDEIKWDLGHIELRTKSTKPGGKLHIFPLTDPIIEILTAEQGNHTQYVFTLTALHNHTNRRTGERFVKGERYPYTRNWRAYWEAALEAAGLWEKGSHTNFRFHDLRHTAGTRLYKITGGNLKLVQRLLGHATIQMSARYAATDVEDLRDVLKQVRPAHFRHTSPAKPELFNRIKSSRTP